MFLFIPQNRTKQQRLKRYWILEKRVPSNFANKLWQTGKYFPKTLHVAYVIQIDKMLVYGILRAPARETDVEICA